MSSNLKHNEPEQNFTWAPLVPLIGGFPVGAERAFGKAPELIASFDGIANDEHYVNYQQKVLGRDHVEFKTYDPEDTTFERKINLVVCTPPCAALSSLNTSSNPEKSGATGEQNQAMYNCVYTAARKFDADVIMIENAPALATKKGKDVADRLYAIGKELGYSLTLYKTSTHFHGIPQRRDRTFACFFKGAKAPVLDFQKLDHLTFKEYLNTMEHNVVNEDTVINNRLLETEPYYNFLKTRFDDVRALAKDESRASLLQLVTKRGLIEEAIAWARDDVKNEKWQKTFEHFIFKESKGMGVWDSSVRMYGDRMNAVVGRNLHDTLHPSEDRSMTYQEALYMMGMPEDFELLGGKKNMNHICQNVPACTSKFISEQALKFLKGELELFESDYLKQDNWKNTLENRTAEEPEERESLEDLLQ